MSSPDYHFRNQEKSFACHVLLIKAHSEMWLIKLSSPQSCAVLRRTVFCDQAVIYLYLMVSLNF